MVLGIRWLRTLGEIYWNFQDMIMKFQIRDQHICVKGIQEKKLQVVEKPLVGKNSSQTIQFCLLQVS